VRAIKTQLAGQKEYHDEDHVAVMEKREHLKAISVLENEMNNLENGIKEITRKQMYKQGVINKQEELIVKLNDKYLELCDVFEKDPKNDIKFHSNGDIDLEGSVKKKSKKPGQNFPDMLSRRKMESKLKRAERISEFNRRALEKVELRDLPSLKKELKSQKDKWDTVTNLLIECELKFKGLYSGGKMPQTHIKLKGLAMKYKDPLANVEPLINEIEGLLEKNKEE